MRAFGLDINIAQGEKSVRFARPKQIICDMGLGCDKYAIKVRLSLSAIIGLTATRMLNPYGDVYNCHDTG